MATCWSQGSQSRRHGRSHSRRRSRRCRRRQLRFRYLEDQRQLLRRGCTEVGDNGAPCGVRKCFRCQAHAAIWGPSKEGRICHLRPSDSPSTRATHIHFHNRIGSWSLRACWGAIQAESARACNLHERLCSPQTAPFLRSPTGSSTQQLGYIAALYTQVSGREGAPYHEAGCSGVCSRGALRLRGGRSWHGGGRRERRSAVAGSPLDQELCCLPAKNAYIPHASPASGSPCRSQSGEQCQACCSACLRTRKSAFCLHAHKHYPFIDGCQPIPYTRSGVNKAGRHALPMSH